MLLAIVTTGTRASLRTRTQIAETFVADRATRHSPLIHQPFTSFSFHSSCRRDTLATALNGTCFTTFIEDDESVSIRAGFPDDACLSFCRSLALLSDVRTVRLPHSCPNVDRSSRTIDSADDARPTQSRQKEFTTNLPFTSRLATIGPRPFPNTVGKAWLYDVTNVIGGGSGCGFDTPTRDSK